MKTKFIFTWIFLMATLVPYVSICQLNQVNVESSFEGLPFVDNLCYQIDMIEKINVVKGLETTTLTEHDKLKFIERRSTKVYNTYFSETSKPVFDVYYKRYDDGFNTWYQMPDLVRTDENATYLYYTKDNELFPGGWFGNIATSQYGTFSNRGRERVYTQTHNHSTNGVYELTTKFYKNYGCLAKLAYKVPTAGELITFQNSGFEVIVDVRFIKIRNSHISITWILKDNIIIEETLESGVVKKSKTMVYMYNEMYKTYLLNRTKTIVHQIFENGECFDEVIDEKYTEYGTACETNDATIRSKDQALGLNIKVSPNPAIDFVEFDLGSVINEKTSIELLGLNGQVVFTQNSTTNQRFIKVDVAKLPAGIYIAKVSTDKVSESIKFVKQ